MNGYLLDLRIFFSHIATLAKVNSVGNLCFVTEFPF
jgi:hypothetical protein